MDLVKEDGTNPTGANTYADDADLVAYAADRGIELPATEEERKVLLIKAMDYLETLDSRFLGYRTLGLDQPLSWPRESVYFGSYYLENNAIPVDLVKVQCVIAVAAMTIDLFPTASGLARTTTRETVGPLTVEYSSTEASMRPIITQANSLLNTLFGFTGQLRVVRG